MRFRDFRTRSPFDDGEIEKCDDIFSRFVIACGDAVKLLQLVEYFLNTVAIPVMAETTGNIIYKIGTR